MTPNTVYIAELAADWAHGARWGGFKAAAEPELGSARETTQGPIVTDCRQPGN